MYTLQLFVFFTYFSFLKDPFVTSYNTEGYLHSFPSQCTTLLDEFAQSAANFTMCSIQYARPVTLCTNCIEQYMKFNEKYATLQNTDVNGTSCLSTFVSHDRLNAVLEYHDNILGIWEKGNCAGCYDWSQKPPVLSNNTIHFNNLYSDTITCIETNLNPMKNNSDEVCKKCMSKYLELDKWYKSLSTDKIGIDTVCMDIVDSMNATRAIWSKNLNCCKIRRTPEVIFLCSTAIISLLPFLYYLAVRFCGPIRDLPNVLKQSRFKQSFIRSMDGNIN